MMAIQLLTWIPPTFCSVLFCSLCNRLHRNVCFEIMYVCMHMEGKILSTQVKEFDFGRGTFYLSVAVAELCVYLCVVVNEKNTKIASARSSYIYSI